jgi:ferrochelatase
VSAEAAGGPTGVLVMAHGTPESADDLPRFVTEIRRGRPPGPQLIAELEHRYEMIGGTSPLAERTARHAGAIARALEARAPGEFTVEIGYKFTSPRIEDAVQRLADAKIRTATGIVLAPHYSLLSVGDYAKRARDAGAALDPQVEVSTVPQWHLAPGFVPLVAGIVRRCVEALPASDRSRAVVVFTAHSLPERIRDLGDPYPEQLRESADAIAAEAELESYTVAWQSAGRGSPEPWLGPDILDVVAGLPASGATTVIVCPIGFVSEHLEVLFDLDVEAAAAASRAGMRFLRTPTLDGNPELAEVLAGVILEAARDPQSEATS